MIDVSVIIPVYNVESYLDKCICSVINQSYKNIEIILVDDGSTDNSSNICDLYSKIDERIKSIHIKNKGVSHARNVGIENSLGKYILFCDSDDYLDEYWIEKLYNEINSNNYDLVIGNYKKVDEKNNDLFYSKFENGIFELKNNDIKTNYLFDKVLDLKHGWAIWSRMFKSEIIRENNIYFNSISNNFGEDLMFTFAYTLYCEKISCINYWGYNYLCRDTSMMNRNINNLKFNDLNYVSKEIYKMFVDRIDIENKDTIFYVFHYLIMKSEYYKLINNPIPLINFNQIFYSIDDYKWFKNNTLSIYKSFRILKNKYGLINSLEVLSNSFLLIHKNIPICKRINHILNKVKMIRTSN